MTQPVGFTDYNPSTMLFYQLKSIEKSVAVTFSIENGQQTPTIVDQEEFEQLKVNNLMLRIILMHYQTPKSGEKGVYLEHKYSARIINETAHLEETFDFGTLPADQVGKQIHNHVLQVYFKTKLNQQTTFSYNTYTMDKPIHEQLQLSKPASQPKGYKDKQTAHFDPLLVHDFPVLISMTRATTMHIDDKCELTFPYVRNFHVKCAHIQLDRVFSEQEFEQVINTIHQTGSYPAKTNYEHKTEAEDVESDSSDEESEVSIKVKAEDEELASGVSTDFEKVKVADAADVESNFSFEQGKSADLASNFSFEQVPSEEDDN